jgi:Uma2 family endonuclease
LQQNYFDMTASTAQFRRQLFQNPMLPKLMVEVADALELERQKRNSFYEWVTPDMKVEFVNGEIIEHSPASEEHNETSSYISRISGTYADMYDIGIVRYEKAMISLTRNDYEPDIAFWKKEIAEGFKKTQTHYPAPSWIVEILSQSTSKRDRGIKFEDYAAHGVEEYWIIDAKKKIVEQYFLVEETYLLHKKLTFGDQITSRAIAGFSIPVAAIFDKEANRLALLEILSR